MLRDLSSEQGRTAVLLRRVRATVSTQERHAEPHLRRVERPPYEQLLREVADDGWSAVGRRYGVSDNAIRKWVRQYERERDGRPP
jgi:hypothetical protein